MAESPTSQIAIYLSIVAAVITIVGGGIAVAKDLGWFGDGAGTLTMIDQTAATLTKATAEPLSGGTEKKQASGPSKVTTAKAPTKERVEHVANITFGCDDRASCTNQLSQCLVNAVLITVSTDSQAEVVNCASGVGRYVLSGKVTFKTSPNTSLLGAINCETTLRYTLKDDDKEVLGGMQGGSRTRAGQSSVEEACRRSIRAYA